MSLRDELVQRLSDVAKSAEVKEGADGIYGKLADEMIRQMEWARSECVESVDSFGAGNSWLSNKELVSAPPEWKPE